MYNRTEAKQTTEMRVICSGHSCLWDRLKSHWKCGKLGFHLLCQISENLHGHSFIHNKKEKNKKNKEKKKKVKRAIGKRKKERGKRKR